MLTLNIYYILNIILVLFFIGVIGLILNRKNILITIMALEIILLAVNLNFIIFSLYLDDIIGQVFVLFILTIAASESAIGLALLTVYYKLKNTIQVDKIKNYKNWKIINSNGRVFRLQRKSYWFKSIII